MPLGIPHSAFLEWEQPDRDKVFAHLVIEADTCPECATRPEEWDPRSGGAFDAYGFEPTFCPGCRKREVAVRDIEREHLVTAYDNQGNPQQVMKPGLKVRTTAKVVGDNGGQ